MDNNKKGGLSGRDFLKYSLAASTCLVLNSVLSGPVFATPTAPASKGEGYYTARKREIMKDFDQTNRGAGQYLKAAYGEKEAQIITNVSKEELARFLPDMPDVGGDENPNTRFIIVAGWYAAYYSPMKALGKSPEDVGRMMYELNRMQYSEMPKGRALEEGERVFSTINLDKMRHWAKRTQQREHPGNWVTIFVEGDGKEFDWGYDYTECGVVKYLRSLGMGDLAPYVCVTDFPRSRALDTGLERTTTLAEGYARCDFRYKKGRMVTRDWATEIPGIRSRIKEGFVRKGA